MIEKRRPLRLFGEANIRAAPIQDLHHALRHDPQTAHNKPVVELGRVLINFSAMPASLR